MLSGGASGDADHSFRAMLSGRDVGARALAAGTISPELPVRARQDEQRDLPFDLCSRRSAQCSSGAGDIGGSQGAGSNRAL